MKLTGPICILSLLVACGTAACGDDSSSSGGGGNAGEGGSTATGGGDTGTGGEDGNTGGAGGDSSSGGNSMGGGSMGGESSGGSAGEATGGTGGQTLVWADVSGHFATDCTNSACHTNGWPTTYAGVQARLVGIEDRINRDPSDTGSMPKGSPAWEHRDEVTAWIQAGAPEN